MEQSALLKLGLTESEQKVYLALLDLGDSTRGQIVNKSGVAGSKVYELLEKLQDKGLVSIYIQNKIKHFKPVNPHQILNYIIAKKEELATIETEARKVLPVLLGRYNATKQHQDVELLMGFHGLEILFREQIDILKKGDTCYVIGGTRGAEDTVVQAFFEKIHLMREEKKIKTKMLFNIRQRHTTEKLYSAEKYPGTTTRYIGHSSPVAINIYKDRTAILIFGNDITSIHIKSEKVANSFKEYFDILWETSK